MAERKHECQRVLYDVENAEEVEIAIIGAVPPGRAPIAALVRRNHVEASGCERQHHLAPAVGKLGKAVQQQDAWPSRLLVARLEHMHREAIDVLNEARADAGRKWKLR